MILEVFNFFVVVFFRIHFLRTDHRDRVCYRWYHLH